MKVRVLESCVAALLLLSTPAAAESRWLPEEPELVRLLRGEGYGRVEQLAEGGVTFKANGMPFLLLRYDDGDLQLYYGLSGVVLPSRALNEWNRTRRLSRAYVDRAGDPVLEADLLANAGLSQELVTEFVRVFVQIAADYRGYVAALQEQLPPAARPPDAL